MTVRALRATVATVNVALILAVSLAPASATAAGVASRLTYNYSYVGSNSGGANLRFDARTSSPSVWYARNNQRVWIICWKDAQVVSPPLSDYTSARWFYIENDGVQHTRGWTHSSLIEQQRQAPRC